MTREQIKQEVRQKAKEFCDSNFPCEGCKYLYCKENNIDCDGEFYLDMIAGMKSAIDEVIQEIGNIDVDKFFTSPVGKDEAIKIIKDKLKDR